MIIYDEPKAEEVAAQFFKYYYHDRGKIKWSGFFHSEHKAELKKQRIREDNYLNVRL